MENIAVKTPEEVDQIVDEAYAEAMVMSNHTWIPNEIMKQMINESLKRRCAARITLSAEALVKKWELRDKRFEELKQEAMNNHDYIDFSGNNCFDVLEKGEQCKGWDGVSGRCYCENRRVDWEFDEDLDVVRAVAY